MEGSDDLEEGCGSSGMGSCSLVPRAGSSGAKYEQGSQLASSSGQLAEISRGSTVLDRYGRRENVQHRSSLQLDWAKHKVFISHSGAQKDFAEQLCVDLERQGYLRPFFDLRQHSLPKGKDFVPLIKKAARNCHVAVTVLSEEFLSSKWPMIELAEFHGAQQVGNPRLNMLPLFYKLSVKDLDETAIEERWMPKWRQLADEDARIIVADWIGAVRALRSPNGVVFGQRGVSEVGYRKDIVQSIFKLSPPDLLYGSSRKMVGYSRVCQAVHDRFVRGVSGGPSYLGLYGASGGGKTTLSKALCEQFCGEYMGRVCHVDLGDGQRMGKTWDEDLNVKLRLGRVKRMLERLCGLDKEALDRITDVDEGLTEMERHMKLEPVFLAIDNVTSENSSWNEACDYLKVGFHPESKIVITSRSKENVWDLVPDIRFCMAMPRLSVMEAGELFLRSAAPSMSIFGLTIEQQRIVGLCIQQCLFYDSSLCGIDNIDFAPPLIGGDGHGLLPKVNLLKLWGYSFHPMALMALGDVFRRYFRTGDMLRWPRYLEGNKDPLWDVWKVRDGMGGIFGLQFHSLPSSEQLLFLDISWSSRYLLSGPRCITLLCDLHDEEEAVMVRRLQDLERSGMIDLSWFNTNALVSMHDIYRRFAEWYMANHGAKGLKNAWCVFKSRGSISNGDNVELSNLVRLQMINESLASSKVLASRMMQKLHNLEVLVLTSCHGVRELNLEGLVSLRYIKIDRMRDLERVSLSGSYGTVGSGGIFDALTYVCLSDLKALVHGPDVRRCTSLVELHIVNCPRMKNMLEMECPHLKVLLLDYLVGHQLARLPHIKALHSLELISVASNSCIFALSDVEASRGVRLRDLRKSFLRVVEEVIMYLRTDWVVNTVECGSVLFWSKSNRVMNGLILLDFSGNIIDEVLEG